MTMNSRPAMSIPLQPRGNIEIVPARPEPVTLSARLS